MTFLNGKPDETKENNIQERKEDFKKSFPPFFTLYGKPMLSEFFEYWTEHGEKDKKMRFEKEKSFSGCLNLKNHGFLIYGESLTDMSDQVAISNIVISI